MMVKESTGQGAKAVSIIWRALRAGLGEHKMEMMGHNRQDRGERDDGRRYRHHAKVGHAARDALPARGTMVKGRSHARLIG